MRGGRFLLAAGLLAAAAGCAGAQDTGTPVTFPAARILGEHSLPAAAAYDGVLFRTRASEEISEPFDTLLFQGEIPAGSGIVFEASRRDWAGVWAAWEAAELRLYPNGRFWAKASFPGLSAGAVRVRAKRFGPASPGTLHVYAMETHAAQAPPSLRPFSGETLPSFPEVILRSAWGAKPPRESPTLHVPVKMTQHHTAGKQTRGLAESMEEVRFIQDFHQNGRGWSDIGYHFLVDAEGRVFEGRPASVQGAHVRDANTGNVGIVLMGFHHPPYDHPVTRRQEAALTDLGRGLIARYAILKTAYAGHRDQGKTSCPGDILYGMLERIKESFSSEGKRADGAVSSAETAMRRAARTASALLGRGEEH